MNSHQYICTNLYSVSTHSTSLRILEKMLTGFQLLGGILNIAQILGVINCHVPGFHRTFGTLQTSDEYAKQIENKIHRLNHLFVQEGLESEILEETTQEF